MAIQKPNHTQVPNDFIDNYVPKLSHSAVRVFLVITRQTIGWHKDTDFVSHSQLSKKTGLSINAIKKAVKELVYLDLLKVEPGNCKGQITKYEIKFVSKIDDPISKNDIALVKPVSKIDIDPISKNDTTKDTNINKINIKINTHVHVACMEKWNQLAKGCHLSKISILTKSRIQKIDVRIKEDPHFIAHLYLTFDKIKQSRYLRGEINGWQVTFDWLFINDKNYIKVCEGNYDDRKGKDKVETILEKYRGK